MYYIRTRKHSSWRFFKLVLKTRIINFFQVVFVLIIGLVNASQDISLAKSWWYKNHSIASNIPRLNSQLLKPS